MKNKIIILSAVCCLLSVSGCDFLDVSPRTQVPADKMFSTEAGYEDALNGCYMKMNSNSLYGRFLTLSGVDFLAGYYEPSSVGSMEVGLAGHDYENDYVKTQLKSTYNDFYNVILQVNDIIEHLDSEQGKTAVRSLKKRNLLKGEALALRAFLHFDILRLFGQVPQKATIMVSLPYSEVTGVETRPLYGFDDYVAKVKKDLADAEELLAEDPCRTYNLNTHVHEEVNDNFYHYRRFRFNYFAVKALKARVCLYTGDKVNAYREAMDIIDAKNPDGTDYFTLAGDNDFNNSYFALPSETIMGLSNSNLENNENERLFKNEQPTFPMLFPRDKRDKMFADSSPGSNNRFNRLWGEVSSSGAEPNPYYKKYMQNEGSASDADKLENQWLVPLLRLSEVYLIAIESAPDAEQMNSLYRKYMLARNVQVEEDLSFKELYIRQFVLSEMRIEFMAEGQLFYAYKRFKSPNMFFEEAGKNLKENIYVVPVPDSERK